jgi:hypothetical protein
VDLRGPAWTCVARRLAIASCVQHAQAHHGVLTRDFPFFREPSYLALTRNNAAHRTDLGMYRARSSAQSQESGSRDPPEACSRMPAPS